MGVWSYIADFVAVQAAKMRSRWRDNPVSAGVNAAIAGELQELEDATWAVGTTTLDIDEAEGVQLDLIGRIIHEDRGNSADDAAYRLRLKGRVAARRSDGRPEKIYKTFRLLIAAAQRMQARLFDSASFELEVTGPATSDAVADVLLHFLPSVRAGGVYAVLIWSPAATADTFATSESSDTVLTQLNGGVSAGATTLTVDATTAFAATGHVEIEPGTGNAEWVRYTALTSTTITVDPIVLDHADNSVVALGIEASGKGYLSILGETTLDGTSAIGEVGPIDLILVPASVAGGGGLMIINPGGANEEERTFDGSDGASVEDFDAPLVYAHDAGEIVQFIAAGQDAGRLAAAQAA